MLVEKHRALFVILASLSVDRDRLCYPERRSCTPGFYAWRLLSGTAHGGRYAVHDNVQIYFETYGSGEPVLVLHGGFGCLEAMHRQIRALAGKYFVIAVDSRGHGRSSDADEPLYLLRTRRRYASSHERVEACQSEMSLAGATVASLDSILPCDILSAFGSSSQSARTMMWMGLS